MKHLLIALLTFVSLAAQGAEPITLKGFHASMTKAEFIALGESMGAEVRDYGDAGAVSLFFGKCLDGTHDRIQGCERVESNVTLGGAMLRQVSRWHRDNTVRVIFHPIEAHRQTLAESIRLKFGPYDKTVKKRVFGTSRTKYQWMQDLNNKMTMPDNAASVVLELDLNKDPDTEDF